MLFEQAAAIEKLSADERLLAEPHLREIKVVLIRTLISDQLAYVNIAKDWFTIQDLREIHQHKIGSGKIGGKVSRHAARRAHPRKTVSRAERHT